MIKHVIFVAALLLGGAFVGMAQQSDEIIKETSNGLFWWSGNEARADAKDLDAAKFRVG